MSEEYFLHEKRQSASRAMPLKDAPGPMDRPRSCGRAAAEAAGHVANVAPALTTAHAAMEPADERRETPVLATVSHP